ncbi:TBC1 domain family member 7-like isoform X2 [Musca domestica]|uniref:TBC1 domain family member 7 n=1 Tax=Musca domestica TaxID=7370 RepID=A0A1I8NDP6_MUSDO|nr:TBC1 domain family member 7 [Musca domestica]XP_058976293.1 TBC1 domain family member 7-like isoform X2 [Musca domestica]
MTADERNFRSSYYEKVGCHSVEEKKSLNKLLQDNIRNHVKLKQFCLSYTVPTTHRSLLWNIILGVMPLHKNSTEFIMNQRKAVYDDLLRAVNIMQYGSTTKPKVLLSMWQLEQNRLLHSGPEDIADQVFMEIVKVLLQIFNDDVETYWLAKEFYACTLDIQQECPRLKELTQTLLKKDDMQLYSHLENLDVFKSDQLLDRWYMTCFAGVINESTLVRVWDKICGGSKKIVVFIFLEMAKALSDKAMKCKTSNEFKNLIEQVKDPDALIVNKAIKAWQNSNQHSEKITVH